METPENTNGSLCPHCQIPMKIRVQEVANKKGVVQTEQCLSCIRCSRVFIFLSHPCDKCGIWAVGKPISHTSLDYQFLLEEANKNKMLPHLLMDYADFSAEANKYLFYYCCTDCSICYHCNKPLKNKEEIVIARISMGLSAIGGYNHWWYAHEPCEIAYKKANCPPSKRKGKPRH
jgi:hypothetical protein